MLTTETEDNAIAAPANTGFKKTHFRISNNYWSLFGESTLEKEKLIPLIRPDVLPFHVVDERFVNYFIAARCGIVSSKIPITRIIGAGTV